MNCKSSRQSSMHALYGIKLAYRMILFILFAVAYALSHLHIEIGLFVMLEESYILIAVVWSIFMVEMLLRAFPSKFESIGCQKQFAKNYKPAQEKSKCKNYRAGSVILIGVIWVILTAIQGVLYYTGIIDEGMLLLISLVYSVLDIVFILFFCPFQTWFMRNKCCATCRIFNWDYMMMFSPIVFIKSVYTMSLFGVAFILFIRWEMTVYKHPDWFSEGTNCNLECDNCAERLCAYKKRIRKKFGKNHKNNMIMFATDENKFSKTLDN